MADERVMLGLFTNRSELSQVVVVKRITARAVVEQAPETTWFTLGLIAASDPAFLWVSDDLIHVGEDGLGNEVVYRVTGWDVQRKALTAVREQ